MEKFTQKWAIIVLFENVTEGFRFYYTSSPLHLTLAGVFKIDHDGVWMSNQLASLLSDQSRFLIVAHKKAMFDKNKEVAVMKIKKTDELMELYQKIYNWLEKSEAIYNEPQYQGEGYLPHSTFQKSGKLQAGQKVWVKSVSIIDLFPDGDGYQRKIFKTIDLK
ncbi:hypothetical protein A3F37_01500 [Candidatus Saccharibacteria bacterium RIFCSPHIGHO2_12_FULL_41_12]|nr:MAG: hypothetical protein A3F37_01500 [Candidatus Saccharibacteria bacterium RIFCSPHIGHO2_12_FULL_41_12]